MVVPPANHGGSKLGRTCQYVARFAATSSAQARPEDARLPAVQDGATPEAGMVCGAKRIRSLYLPWMTGVTPKLSTTTPPKGLASLSTMNDATMRLCRADLPATAH